MLTEQSSILHRWKEHFEQLLSQSSVADVSILNCIKQRPILHTGDEEPTEEKDLRAVSSMTKGKDAGKDGMQAEALQLPGSHLQQEFIKVLKQMRRKDKVPQGFKYAIVVPIGSTYARWKTLKW